MKTILTLLLLASLNSFAQKKSDPTFELYRARIIAAEALLRLNETGEAKQQLADSPAKVRGWEWNYLNGIADNSRLTLNGHRQAVASAAVSPNGSVLATGSADSTIRLWNAADGKLLAVLTGHTGQVSTLDFSPDGSLLLSGSTDKSVKLWNVEQRKEIRTITDGLSQGIYCVKFHPDGKRIGVASWDFTRTPFAVFGFVNMHDSESGKRLLRIPGTAHPMSSIDFSPDGKRLLTGDWGMLLQIVDPDSGTQLVKIDIDDRNDYRAIQSVSFSPDGKSFLAGGKDNRVRIFDAHTGAYRKTIESWEGHSKDVNSVVYSDDGTMFATASADGIVKVWDAISYQLLRMFHGHSNAVTSVVFSPDGRRLFSASKDQTVKVWDLSISNERSFDVCQAGPWSAPVSPNGKMLAVASSDSGIGMWDPRTGTKLGTLPVYSANAAAFSRDNSYLVTGGHSYTAQLWNTTTFDSIRSFVGHTNSIFSVSIVAEKNLVATGSSDKTVRIWDMHTGEEIKRLTFEKTSVQYVSFDPSGTLLVGGARDGSITVWETGSWRTLAAMTLDESVTNIVFSNDGSLFLTTGGNGTVAVWNARTFKRVCTLSGHQNAVYGAAFHPNNTRVATVSYDQTIRLWDIPSGKQMLSLNKGKELYTAGFINDGSALMVTQTDGIVFILKAAAPVQ